MESGFDLFSTIRRIEIATRTPARGMIQGIDRSFVRQTGIEFAELREYVPGDDIRHLDWKVTARMDRPFMRECTGERDQTYYFVIDRSGSCAFGSEIPKERMMLEIAASLMYAAYRDGEQVALCCFTDGIECLFPPGRGKKHLIASLKMLSTHTPSKKATDLGPVIEYLCSAVKRRSAVVIISDFFCPVDTRLLSVLCRRHEVTAVQVVDRNEEYLPDIGMIMTEDEETGDQVLIDTSDRSVREAYASASSEYNRHLSSAFARARAGFVRIGTDNDYAAILNRYFRRISRGI
jgi:Uncharacterized conserved protein (some members contain a von Willebrand factor type A (vWA) domain)